MMYAQYIAAQAFNSGGLGIIHSISHAVSAFYDSHHGLNNAVALPRVWEFNLPARYERFADIAVAMGVDTHGMTKVQASEAALEAAIRLIKDVNIPENFTSVDDYTKNRMDTGVYEGKGRRIRGDDADVERVAKHVMGDACTPGNPQECTVENLKPVVQARRWSEASDHAAPESGGRPSSPPRSLRASGDRMEPVRDFGPSPRSWTGFAAADYVTTEQVATVVYLATQLRQAGAGRGPAGRGQDRTRQDAGPLQRPASRAAAVLRGPGRHQGAVRVGLRQAAALHPAPARADRHAARRARPSSPRRPSGCADHEEVFFSEHFLVERPLLEAIRSPEPTVLLIDEIDRADEHLEALMLEVLAEFQVTIPELGTLSSRTHPWVIITSNTTRDVSEALKRRCLAPLAGYPSAERELEILRLKVPGDRARSCSHEVVEVVRAVRELDLRKAPSISEALDWARALTLLNVASLDREVIEETISLIIKHDKDVERVQQELPRLLGMIDALDHHDHAHARGHDHHHDHGHGHHHHGHDDPSPEEQAYQPPRRGLLRCAVRRPRGPYGVDAPILRFVGLLRQRGVRISPAETLDALCALAAVPLERRDMVKTALRATLIKEASGRADLRRAVRGVLLGRRSGRRARPEHDHDHDHDQDEPSARRPPSRSPTSRPTSTIRATRTSSPRTSPSTSTTTSSRRPSACTRTAPGSTWPGSARS